MFSKVCYNYFRVRSVDMKENEDIKKDSLEKNDIPKKTETKNSDEKVIVKKFKRFYMKIINFSLKAYLHKLKKDKIAFLELCVVFILLITLISTAGIIFSKLNNNYGVVKYIEENGIRYIGIKDGFITEKLVVESGDPLPEIKEYFSENYDLDDDASIKYYEDNDELSLEAFTYKKNDVYYVRDYKNINVEISNKGETYKTLLVIDDNKAPHVILQNVSIIQGDLLDANNFVAVFDDQSQTTDFTATMIGSLDYSNVGTYSVSVSVCDIANNCTDGDTQLTVRKKATSTIAEDDKLTSDDESKPTASEDKGDKNNNSNGSSNNSNSNGSSNNNSGGNSNNNSNSNSNNNNNNNNGNSGNSGNNSSGNGNSNNNSGSSGNSNNNSNSGSGETNNNSNNSINSNTKPAERVYLGTKTSENFPIKTIDHYGAKEITYAKSVTYDYYSDGYIQVKNYTGDTWVDWDYSGYKADIPAMKVEALTHWDLNSYTRSLFIEQTNKIRKSYGLADLELDNELCNAAQVRALEIIYSNNFSHTRPIGGSVKSLVNEYGIIASGKEPYYGENIARGYQSDYSAFRGFANSSGHLAIMTRSYYKKMGVARIAHRGTNYWVVLFIT